MLAIKSTIPSKLLNSPDNLEILSVSLLGYIAIHNMLNSHSSKCRDISISNYLLSFNDSEKLIVLGDFNFTDIYWAAYSNSNPLYALILL